MHAHFLRRRAETSPFPQWSRFLESQQAAKMQCKESYFPLKKSTNSFYIAPVTQTGQSAVCTPEMYSPLCLKAGRRDPFFSPFLTCSFLKWNRKLWEKSCKKKKKSQCWFSFPWWAKFLCSFQLFSSVVNSPTVTAESFHLNKNVWLSEKCQPLTGSQIHFSL